MKTLCCQARRERKNISKKQKEGLREQKKGDATQLFILMSTVQLLRHVVFITMLHYLSSVKDYISFVLVIAWIPLYRGPVHREYEVRATCEFQISSIQIIFCQEVKKSVSYFQQSVSQPAVPFISDTRP